MLGVLFRSHRLAKKRLSNAYTAEFAAWRLDYKASIQQHGKDFWDIQTDIENEWIEKYNAAVRRGADRKATKNREGVIRIAKHTIDLQYDREERARKVESNLRRKAEQYAKDLFKKKLLIDTMNLESSQWINIDNYKTAIAEHLLIPHNLDNSSYFVKLREESFVAGMGKMISKQDHYSNRKEAQFKNQMLSKYFTELKAAIKALTYSPLQPLFEDFEADKARLFDYPEKIRAISEKYQALAAAWKAKEKHSVDTYINRLHRQLQLTCKLAKNWNEYIRIAKLDDVEINLVRAALPNNIRMQEFRTPNDDWAADLEAGNPETSDANEVTPQDPEIATKAQEEQGLGGESHGRGRGRGEKGEKERGKEKEKEEEEEEVQGMSEEVDSEAEFVLKFKSEEENASDFDMYKGEKEQTPEVNSKIIDNFMSEVLQEINSSREYFQSQESLSLEDIERQSETKEYSPITALNSLKDRVEALQEKDLDLQTKWKQGEILKYIEHLNNTKIDEPHMLLKVFNHHRYDIPVFK